MKKRLVVDVPADLHKQLKFIALRYNVSLSRLVLNAIFAQLAEDKEYNKNETED